MSASCTCFRIFVLAAWCVRPFARVWAVGRCTQWFRFRSELVRTLFTSTYLRGIDYVERPCVHNIVPSAPCSLRPCLRPQSMSSSESAKNRCNSSEADPQDLARSKRLQLIITTRLRLLYLQLDESNRIPPPPAVFIPPTSLARNALLSPLSYANRLPYA